MILLFGVDALPARFMRSQNIFLDKACIHQVDTTLQRQGIESLGGFLFYSWSMVVLYTPVYTTKLWTVYEMACFLSVHPGGRLVWLPADLWLAVVFGPLLIMFNTVALWATSLRSTGEWITVPAWLLILPLLPAAVGATFVFDKVVRDQAKSEEDLRLFSIRNAVCAVEGDRAIVEGNVASLMQDLKLVQADSTQEEALLAFDRLVQTTLPRAIRDSSLVAPVSGTSSLAQWSRRCYFPVLILWALDVSAGASIQAVVATMLRSTTYACSRLCLSVPRWSHNCVPGAVTSREPKRTVFVLLVGVVCLPSARAVWAFAAGLLHSRAQEDLIRVRLILSGLSRTLPSYVPGVQEASRKASQAPHRRRLGDTRRIGRGTQIPHSAD